MFSSFKSTELFRYFIRDDINNGIDKIIQQNKSNYSMVTGSIFSGLFSILGTYFGMHENEFSKWQAVIIVLIGYIVLFGLGMYIYNVIKLFMKFIINLGRREKLSSEKEAKDIINQFDDIACDNILISQNFIEAYSDTNASDDLKEFYFYETIYYTKVSVNIINKLIINKRKCIGDSGSTNKVQLFRLENSLKMIKIICEFLNAEKESVKYDNVLKKSLINEILDLQSSLNKCINCCEKIKEDTYGVVVRREN